MVKIMETNAEIRMSQRVCRFGLRLKSKGRGHLFSGRSSKSLTVGGPNCDRNSLRVFERSFHWADGLRGRLVWRRERDSGGKDVKVPS